MSIVEKILLVVELIGAICALVPTIVSVCALIKNIIKKLKKRKLPKMQKASLAIIGINPCFVFSIAIKFRRLLESFL